MNLTADPLPNSPDVVDPPGHRRQHRQRAGLGLGGAAQVGDHVLGQRLPAGPGQRAVEQHDAVPGEGVARLALDRERQRGGLDDHQAWAGAGGQPGRARRDIDQRRRGGQRGHHDARAGGGAGRAGGGRPAAPGVIGQPGRVDVVAVDFAARGEQVGAQRGAHRAKPDEAHDCVLWFHGRLLYRPVRALHHAGSGHRAARGRDGAAGPGAAGRRPRPGAGGRGRHLRHRPQARRGRAPCHRAPGARARDDRLGGGPRSRGSGARRRSGGGEPGRLLRRVPGVPPGPAAPVCPRRAARPRPRRLLRRVRRGPRGPAAPAARRGHRRPGGPGSGAVHLRARPGRCGGLPGDQRRGDRPGRGRLAARATAAGQGRAGDRRGHPRGLEA